VADGNGVAVAYPEAIGGMWNYRPDPDGPDDTGFIAALVDRLAADGEADPKRVYLTGISRGGLMTWRLMCVRPELFAAAAPLSSAMSEAQVPSCRPARPVPVLAEDGSADPVMAYDGWLPPAPQPRLLSVPETMEFWRRLHGCTGETATHLPHREASDPTRVTRYDWTGCAAPVVLLKVTGGGHMPASFAANTEEERAVLGRRGRDVETAAEVWKFFQAASGSGG
jgi:polyhydroxybutyrate depolymerase